MLRYSEASRIDQQGTQILRKYAQDDAVRAACASKRVHRRGISVILVCIMLVALIAFVSLAVDVGRVRLARAQLETVADASARAGVRSLPDSTPQVFDFATRAAAENHVINTDPRHGQRTDPGVDLNPIEDIHFGVWDASTRSFTEVFDEPATFNYDERRVANAVRTNARRLTARGNPVRLIFAPVVGVFESDIEREATAYISGGPDSASQAAVDNFVFVGIEGIDVTGNRPILRGNLVSDGDIHLGNAAVFGDVRVRAGRQLTHVAASVITGWTADRIHALAPRYPVKAAINPRVLPSDGVLQGGTLANPMVYEGAVPATLTISGFVEVYATSMDAWPTLTWTQPLTPAANRLKIYLPATIPTLNVNNNTQQAYAHLYAPATDITLSGSNNFTGWIVGKSLTFTSGASYNSDGTKERNVLPPYNITLVE